MFLVIAGVLFTGLVAAIGWTLLYIWIAGRPRAARRADAIVVFGAEATARGPCRELAARLDHAAELYRFGMAPRILCCGGRSGAISEAVTMADYLLSSGLPTEAVLTDEACPSTRAALEATRRHAAGRWDTVLLVSSPYHLCRIMSEARWWGVRAIACPTGRTPLMVRFRPRTRQMMREVAAIWWYAVTRIGRESTTPSPLDSHPIGEMEPASAWSPVVPERR